MVRLVILLLALVPMVLGSDRPHVFRLINEAKTWAEAQSYCREKSTDLVTIHNLDDMNMIKSTTGASDAFVEKWIGLKKDRVELWHWSVGENQIAPVEYSNWGNFSFPKASCAGMWNNGTWAKLPCRKLFPFVCQRVDGSNGTVWYFVNERKTWHEAQDTCRRNNSHLAIVRNEAENNDLWKLIDGPGLPHAWMGLFENGWSWSDGSNVSFTYWGRLEPNVTNRTDSCIVYNSTYDGWFVRSCAERHPFYCYEASVPVKRTIVRVELHSDTLFDLHSSAEAILSQIQNRSGGLKFQWRVQPDGKIFHKKEVKNGTSQNDDNEN